VKQRTRWGEKAKKEEQVKEEVAGGGGRERGGEGVGE
jgi:hypothetical protein